MAMSRHAVVFFPPWGKGVIAVCGRAAARRSSLFPDGKLFNRVRKSILQDRKRAAGISRLSLGLLACFVAFNLVIIPPASIDHTSLPDYSAGEYRLYFYPSEYAAIALIPPGTRVAGDQAIWHLMSSYRPDSTVNVDLKLFGGDPADLQAYDYFVVRNEDFGIVFSATAKLPATTVTNQTYGSLLANQNLCLVYANGSVQIFKVTKNT